MTLHRAIFRIRRAVSCALGRHAWTRWYAPTGRDSDPLYEERIECLWCLRRYTT